LRKNPNEPAGSTGGGGGAVPEREKGGGKSLREKGGTKKYGKKERGWVSGIRKLIRS